MKWEKKKIEDICLNITSGGTPKSTNEAFYNPQEIPWLKTGEVNYCRIYDTEKYISKEGLYNSSAKIIPTNSVMVAMYGQGDTAGRVAINKIPLTTNQACCNLIINDKVADYEFVYYKLSTLYEKMVSLKNGGAQPNLNVKIIKSIEISLPPLPVQQRIASILSAYDDLIENNQKQIKLLEEAAQRLYKEWFVDLRFPGHEGVKVVDGVPEGWKKEKLIELAELKAGGDKPKIFSKIKSNICKVPIFSNGLENEGLFGYTDKADIGQESITISARGNVGYTCLRREPYLAIVRLICVIPRKMHISTYLYFYLKHTNYNSNGSAQQQLTIPMIKNTVVCVPDENILSDFDDKARCYFDLVDALKNKISSLREARDRLLPKLMSGEIEV